MHFSFFIYILAITFGACLGALYRQASAVPGWLVEK